MRHFSAVLIFLSCLSLGLAQPPDDTARTFHVFPQIADGAGWQSTLSVTNVSADVSQCTLSLYGLDVERFADISAIEATGSNAIFELEDRGDFLVWPTINESAVLASGYATLDCSEPVAAQILYRLTDQDGATEGLATVFSSQSAAVFQLPVFTQGDLAIAIANNTEMDAACNVLLESLDRLNLGEAVRLIPSKSKVAQFLSDVIQTPGGFTGGSVTISCNQQVSVIGLQIEGPIFTTLPAAVISIEPEPEPDPQPEPEPQPGPTPQPDPEPEVDPDLVVGTPWVDDASPEPGATFTLTVSVTNESERSPGSNTTLRYYRSTDADISRSDTEVGTDRIRRLPGTSVESISLIAPSTPGTYFYGACVDVVSGESYRTNNCSGSVSVVVSP